MYTCDNVYLPRIQATDTKLTRTSPCDPLKYIDAKFVIYAARSLLIYNWRYTKMRLWYAPVSHAGWRIVTCISLFHLTQRDACQGSGESTKIILINWCPILFAGVLQNSQYLCTCAYSVCSIWIYMCIQYTPRIVTYEVHVMYGLTTKTYCIYEYIVHIRRLPCRTLANSTR